MRTKRGIEKKIEEIEQKVDDDKLTIGNRLYYRGYLGALKWVLEDEN